jgi:Lipocalin-like domain
MSVFRYRWLIGGLLIGITSGFASRAVPRNRRAAADELIGTWKLVRRTQRFADGTSRQHPVSVGYLIYTDARRVCYVAMDPTRPAWASATAPTPEEAARSVAGLGAYCSRVDVNVSEGYVVHHIEIEKSPNLVGHDRKRWFTFDNPDQLRLRVDRSELQSPIVDDELVWARVRE